MPPPAGTRVPVHPSGERGGTSPWTASTTSLPSRWKAAYATLPPTVPRLHDVALAVLHPPGPLGTLRLGNHTQVGQLRILRRPSDDWRRTVTSPQTSHNNCDGKERNAAGASCFDRLLRRTITAPNSERSTANGSTPGSRRKHLADGVVDFDPALCNQSDSQLLNPACSGPDHLEPNLAG